MSKVKILVVEDEAIVARDIKVCLNKIGYDVLGSHSSGESALEAIEKEKPDLILMDIMLKGKLSGIETSAAVKEKYSIPVVFLTAYADEKTISKAKVTEPYGYIIKPFKEIDLRTSIEMALYKYKKEKEKEQNTQSRLEVLYSMNTKSNDYIYVKSNSRLIKVNNEDILFVEALKDYVVIHVGNEKYTIHSTMKDIAKKLPETNFQRIHRSYIVNLKQIKAIEMPNLILEKSNIILPVGGSYKEELFNKLNLV
jgi:DNA-binding LytR/AlgR family response regulator